LRFSAVRAFNRSDPGVEMHDSDPAPRARGALLGHVFPRKVAPEPRDTAARLRVPVRVDDVVEADETRGQLLCEVEILLAARIRMMAVDEPRIVLPGESTSHFGRARVSDDERQRLTELRACILESPKKLRPFADVDGSDADLESVLMERPGDVPFRPAVH